MIVRVNDRGPFTKGRIIDLSYAAAQRLGVAGVATVNLVRITPEQIRRGEWLANPVAAPAGDAAPAPEQVQGSCSVCLTPPRV